MPDRKCRLLTKNPKTIFLVAQTQLAGRVKQRQDMTETEIESASNSQTS